MRHTLRKAERYVKPFAMGILKIRNVSRYHAIEKWFTGLGACLFGILGVSFWRGLNAEKHPERTAEAVTDNKKRSLAGSVKKK